MRVEIQADARPSDPIVGADFGDHLAPGLSRSGVQEPELATDDGVEVADKRCVSFTEPPSDRSQPLSPLGAVGVDRSEPVSAIPNCSPSS